MAVNQSIYLMLAVPYTAFGVMGFLVYRGIRKNDAYRQSVTEQTSPDQIATPDATVS
jgi:CHASE3 domain sensor protein